MARGAQMQAGELAFAVARDEDFIGRVNPDLLNALIIEEGLDDPETADFIVEPLDDDAPLPHIGQGDAGALLLIFVQTFTDERAYGIPVLSRVQVATAHGLANVLLK